MFTKWDKYAITSGNESPKEEDGCQCAQGTVICSCCLFAHFRRNLSPENKQKNNRNCTLYNF